MISNPNRHTPRNNLYGRYYKTFLAAIRKQNSKSVTQNANSQEGQEKTKINNSRREPVKWTDVVNVIISGVLAYYTYALFQLAGTQTQIAQVAATDANRSANAAISAAEEARNGNEISRRNFDLAQKSFQSGNADALKRFSLDSIIINSQIEYLKLTHEDFLISNKPVLQIVDIRLDSIQVGKRIHAFYKVQNFGRQPAKILNGRLKLWASVDSTYNDFSNLSQATYKRYLPSYASLDLQALYKAYEWTFPHVRMFSDGQFFIFLMGELEYLNSVTGETGIYRYNYRLSNNPWSIFPLTDDDYYVRKKK